MPHVYNSSSSSLSALNFKDKNPSLPNSYSNKYNFPAEKTGYTVTRNRFADYSENENTLNTNYNKYESPYSPSETPSYYKSPVTTTSEYSKSSYIPVSSTYKPYEQPSYAPPTTDAKQKDYTSSNYDQYGEYASDFSSPAILAILRKRTQGPIKEEVGQGKESVNWRDMNRPQNDQNHHNSWTTNY